MSEGYTRITGEQVGPWTLLSPVGRGGFSEVWRARSNLGEEAALKLLIHPEHVGQLRQEASALALVRGDGIVPIRAIGLDDDPPWIALTLLDGGNLRQRMRKELIAPASQILYFERILDVLARVHREGIVHGDLKPENVLFTRGDQLFLADFGLSRRIAQRSASLSVSLSLEDARLAGTLDYMAPEQRAGDKPDARSDVYAAGVILYELLTGERPQGVFKMPSDLDPSLPPVVDRLIACSLAQDPRHRFASAGPMLAFLRAGVTSDWKELASAQRRLEALVRLSAAGQAHDGATTLKAAAIALGTMSIILAGTKQLGGAEELTRFFLGCLAGVLAVATVLRAARPWLAARFDAIVELKRKVELQIRTGGEWSRAVEARRRSAPRGREPGRSAVYPPPPRPAASPWSGVFNVLALLMVGFILVRACAPSRPPAPSPVWTPPPPLPAWPAPTAFPLARYGERVNRVASWSFEREVGSPVAIAAVESRIFVATSSGAVRIHADPRSSAADGHFRDGEVAGTILTGLGELVAVAAAPGRVAVVDRADRIAVFAEGGRRVALLDRGGDRAGTPIALALSRDGRLLAFATRKRLRIVDLETAGTCRDDTILPERGAVTALSFDGTVAIAVTSAGQLLRADAARPTEAGRWRPASEVRNPLLAGLSGRGEWIAVQSFDGEVAVCDAAGTPLGVARSAPRAAWLGVPADGDGVLLLDRTGDLHRVDVRLGAASRLVRHITDVVLLGGSRFATLGRDGTVTEYEVER